MALSVTGSREDGRALYVLETDGTLMGIVPSTMLDDAVGNDATEDARRTWVEENGEEISKALRVKHTGTGFTRAPFGETIPSTKIG